LVLLQRNSASILSNAPKGSISPCFCCSTKQVIFHF